MTTATKTKQAPAKTQAEAEAEEWRRIEAARAGERAERAAARATWTPSAIAAVETAMARALPGWRKPRRGGR